MSKSKAGEFDTPNIQASQAQMMVHSTTLIDAPASLVFRILRNTETWKDWNRFVPRVNITYQPPDPDLVTAAEVVEIVRNTSIAGSFESDLTEAGGKQRTSDEEPPPRVRLNSTASRGSDSSQTKGDMKAITTEAFDNYSMNSQGSRRASAVEVNIPTHSGAQKFEAARRASVASGHSTDKDTNKGTNKGTNNIVNADALIAAAAEPAPTTNSGVPKTNARKRSVDVRSASKSASNSVAHLYGEPSVRIQLNTKMTFLVRMNPTDPTEFKRTAIVVTEVSRPDDPFTEPMNLTSLTRAKTHTLSRSGVYRIVWAMNHEHASSLNLADIFTGRSVPKYLLQAERVHEIRPIYNGDGTETSCEYKTWECQKGPMAKIVNKKYGAHIQDMFKVWGYGIKEFCEGLNAPGVSRRDFSIGFIEE